MNFEPFWLRSPEVVAINLAVVTATGENHLVLSPGNLEGALMRPVNLFNYEGEEDIVVLAAKFMIAICMAHAFEQGNKRTGWLAGVQFLNANGYDVVLPEDRHKEFMFMALSLVIKHRSTDDQFAERLNRFVVDL